MNLCLWESVQQRIFEHFNHFIDGLMLERMLFLCYGMDGPYVNKKFENSFEKDLVSKGTTLLSVDTCTLHKDGVDQPERYSRIVFD